MRIPCLKMIRMANVRRGWHMVTIPFPIFDASLLFESLTGALKLNQNTKKTMHRMDLAVALKSTAFVHSFQQLNIFFLPENTS